MRFDLDYWTAELAHQITGTKWNGWVFFGLKNHQVKS
ncbi:hypothetical protein V1281_006763 [Nitrobacteraceae bacterium AZCC 2161]